MVETGKWMVLMVPSVGQQQHMLHPGMLLSSASLVRTSCCLGSYREPIDLMML